MANIPAKTQAAMPEPLAAPAGVDVQGGGNGRSPLKATLPFMLLLAIPLAVLFLLKAWQKKGME